MKHRCILTSFLWVACTNKTAEKETETETADTYEVTGDGWGCVGKDSTWTHASFDIWTRPTGAPATQVELFRVGDGWIETHALSLAIENNADGYDFWLVDELEIVAETAEYASGVRTLFTCEAEQEAQWAGKFSVFDHDGTIAHCSLRGDDTSVFEDDGCESDPWS